jgi:hypothetical protein
MAFAVGPSRFGGPVKVLGFDPSLTNFGWALYDSAVAVGDPERCGAHGRFQTSAKTLFIDRYVDLRQRVSALVTEHGVTRIGIEYPVFGESYSSGLYGLFLYTCEALRAAKCDVVFFSPGQGKAHAARALNRPPGWKMMKGDMVEAARVHMGAKRGMNHNEADAYWIAHAATRFWELLEGTLPAADLSPLEAKQFSKIHTFTRGKRAGDTVRSGLLFRENERFFRWSSES